MNRFKMSFINSAVANQSYYNNLASNVSVTSVRPSASRSSALNAPMIERVYKAKPGCSACGKKVA